MILRAIKSIKPGDEITYDYGPEYFEIFLQPAGCKCDKCMEKRRKQRRERRVRSKRKAKTLKACSRCRMHAQAYRTHLSHT